MQPKYFNLNLVRNVWIGGTISESNEIKNWSKLTGYT